LFAKSRTLAQRILQVDGDAVLLQEIGERFIGQFLNRRHPVASQLLELVEHIFVERDQFAHGWPVSSRQSQRREKSTRSGHDGIDEQQASPRSITVGTGSDRKFKIAVVVRLSVAVRHSRGVRVASERRRSIALSPHICRNGALRRVAEM
jgi:hypothetical protein